ncbi:hypothetical protein HZF05_03180 [Sphingomonas sp. CGMCC 1.13654]|uniref:Uncharacterized protein n=1 Tax=Sphingomonas chungangi TaxID=2683589 RepID=A0A838L0S2_9SPHN|nr:hypothetical protein [Sphingomonas chungangi]MBA2933093.1 hypothetical protein [Sphingomonas chungangi]MVW56713.1 hypothetical protein [Sphingomonas chungangi]
MIFHVSIAAAAPRHVAGVLAELWGGTAAPFPPVSEDGWIVFADDDRGSAIEVYPEGVVLREVDGDADAVGIRLPSIGLTSTHIAMATVLDHADVMRIAVREGWPAKYRKRGGMFGVIELWVEGAVMIEVLTAEMQAEYRRTMSSGNWLEMLAAMRMAA